MFERHKKIAPDFPDTVRRLNYLVEQLKLTNYLEIGLGNGGTFDHVSAANKVGVDPTPWNPAVRDLKGVHTITSDDYFSLHWNEGTKFDLILLDGLHTAEQTYRDFVNSLHFAHSKTIWLIDDVMPNDVFSAIPQQGEAVKLRKAATGSDDTAWHGDVYKALWMVRTFHNNMVLRTFRGNQTQALVYHAGGKKTPISNATLTEIANLTYVDTLVRRAEYNLGDEDEILRECVAAIRNRGAM